MPHLAGRRPLSELHLGEPPAWASALGTLETRAIEAKDDMIASRRPQGRIDLKLP
jgi:hypothetical protein